MLVSFLLFLKYKLSKETFPIKIPPGYILLLITSFVISKLVDSCLSKNLFKSDPTSYIYGLGLLVFSSFLFLSEI